MKTCFPSAHPYFCNWLIFTLSTAYLGVLNYVIYVKVVPFELNSMLKIVRRISLIYMLYVYIFSSIFVLLFLRTNYICRDLILYITLPISYITSVQYHHHAFSGVVFFYYYFFSNGSRLLPGESKCYSCWCKKPRSRKIWINSRLKKIAFIILIVNQIKSFNGNNWWNDAWTHNR